jgi:hypothetical protein
MLSKVQMEGCTNRTKGQGRGHEFAHAANLGVGALDWADSESMVDEMIKRGVADPDHLGVGGWSQGKSRTTFEHAAVVSNAVKSRGIHSGVGSHQDQDPLQGCHRRRRGNKLGRHGHGIWLA